MKKFYNIILIFVAIVATAFVGCTNAESDIDNTATTAPNTDIYRQLTFSAENDNDASRTHHNGETIVWSKGDRIRICYTKGGVWQNAEGREAGAEEVAKLYASDEQSTDSEFSVFRVTQLFNDPGTESELVFYGLYPSEATKGNKPDFADSEAGLVNVSIPQIQTPSATSFDSSADLMVARSRDTYDQFPSYEDHISMYWTRLVAHGMITLKGLSAVEGYMDDETIEYVEFEVDPSVALAGDFSLDLAAQAITPTAAKNKIRLTYADNEEHNTLDGDGNFVVWFASAPFTTESITVTLATNRAIYTRTFASANKTFKVNTRSLLGINMSGAERTARTMVDMFELVTDASVLAVGKKVVIAAKDYDVAMSTSKGSNDRKESSIIKDGNLISIDSTVEVFELQEGTVDGTWAFYESDYGYIYQSSGTLKSTKTLSNSCNWVVEVADTGVATISAKSSTSNKIRYNSSSKIFRTYSGTNKDIALYHNVPSTTPLMSQMSAAPVIATAEETESNIVNVEWTHELTGMTLTGLYYTVTCLKEGEEDVVYSSITETEFVVDNLAAGEWSITVTAHADSYTPITSEPVTVTVLGLTPTLTIEPTELLFEGAGGTKQIEVATKNLGSNLSITAESDNAAFTTSVSGTTVSVSASKNPNTAERSGKITITASGSKATLQVEVAVLQEIGMFIYKKVSGTLKDFSGGQYLIVCEGENLAFDGSLSTLNAAENNFIVSVRNGEIALAAANNDIYFTIEKVTSGYAIKSASGKYIGATSNTTTLNTSTTTKYANTISFNGNEMDIVSSGGAYLRFNKASTSMRFSYYPSTSFTDHQPIQLYKLDGTGNDEMLTPLDVPVPTATVNANTITVSWPEVANAGSYTVTCGDALRQTVTTTSATFEDLSFLTTYEISVAANPADGDSNYSASVAATITATTGENPNAGQGAIDIINLDFTGRTTTSNVAWTNVAASTVEYAGCSAKTSNAAGAMYFNTGSTSSTKGAIVTTSSVGKVTMIVVTWNPKTANGKALQIYGKNTPYAASKDLYSSSDCGTLLGSIVYGTSTAFVINGSYKYIGLSTNNNVMYIDEIQVVWNYTPLAQPTINTTVEGSTVNVSWSEVANAANYTVTCGDEVQTVTGTSASFANVPYLSTSNVSVVANPVAGSTEYCSSAAATATVEIGENPTTGVEYTFTILPADFPSSASTNNKTSIATATDGSGVRMLVSWTSTSTKLNTSGYISTQNGSKIYNTSDLGSVTDVSIASTSTKLTTTIGTTAQPTTAGEGGYFMVKASGTVSDISGITVTFEK